MNEYYGSEEGLTSFLTYYYHIYVIQLYNVRES